MKKIVITLVFLFCIVKFCDAQESNVKVHKFTNRALINMLCSVDTTILKSNYQLAVRIYRVNNGSGSAHFEGTDEVSNNFVIAVSSKDEVPEVNAYTVGSFLYPKIVSFEEKSSKEFLFVIETGIKDHRKKVEVTIGIDKIIVN